MRSTTARLRDIRRRRSVGRSLNGWNGLVFEAGRLVVFVEIGLQGEGLVTSLAVEVLESRMGLHVSSKVGPDQQGVRNRERRQRTQLTCQRKIYHSGHSRTACLQCEISCVLVVARDD